jgi:hypothetical protein
LCFAHGRATRAGDVILSTFSPAPPSPLSTVFPTPTVQFAKFLAQIAAYENEQCSGNPFLVYTDAGTGNCLQVPDSGVYVAVKCSTFGTAASLSLCGDSQCDGAACYSYSTEGNDCLSFDPVSGTISCVFVMGTYFYVAVGVGGGLILLSLVGIVVSRYIRNRKSHISDPTPFDVPEGVALGKVHPGLERLLSTPPPLLTSPVFCSECGTPLPTHGSFCQKCGRAVGPIN